MMPRRLTTVGKALHSWGTGALCGFVVLGCTVAGIALGSFCIVFPLELIGLRMRKGFAYGVAPVVLTPYLLGRFIERVFLGQRIRRANGR